MFLRELTVRTFRFEKPAIIQTFLEVIIGSFWCPLSCFPNLSSITVSKTSKHIYLPSHFTLLLLYVKCHFLPPHESLKWTYQNSLEAQSCFLQFSKMVSQWSYWKACYTVTHTILFLFSSETWTRNHNLTLHKFRWIAGKFSADRTASNRYVNKI